MNFSVQKEIVLKSLENNVVHPTAEFLHEIIHKNHPKISKATVYRNLNKMAEEGIIKKIDGLEDSAHYDHNTHEHYHFICKNCGKVFDVSKNVAPDIITKAFEETGFEIENYDITFQGVCTECTRNNQ